NGDQVWETNTCCHPKGNNNPGNNNVNGMGQWSNVINWPNIALHSVLTPNKTVLTYGTDKRGIQGARLYYDIWDPAKGIGANAHNTLPNTTGTDIFCTAPAIIPETGEILLSGGDRRGSGIVNDGVNDALIFNSKRETLRRTTSMANARWYPTATALPNGEIFIHGGRAGKKEPIIVPEIFNPKTNQWRSLTGAASPQIISGAESRWFYPRNFVIPDGRIFGMTGSQMYYLSTQGRGGYTLAGKLPPKSTQYTSSAVMFEPGKILQVGGSKNGAVKQPAPKDAIVVDVTGKNPVVKSVAPMKFPRSWPDATVLPTGEVLVTGGSLKANTLVGTVEVPEIWNPKTNQWKSLAKAQLPRLYHSTALLLPDARVLVAGGGAPGPLRNTNAEIFSPPYLFAKGGGLAKRLKIVNSADASDHGKTLAVKYTIGAGQQKAIRATLVRNGSATHSFNMEQRFIELDLQQAGPDQVNVKLPGSVNIAPPGFYMLFLLDANNVPSDGHMLKLNVPAGGGGDNKGQLQVTVSDATVTEGVGSAKITISLSAASNKQVKVRVKTANATAQAGADFNFTNILLTFQPGQTIKEILVPVKNDNKQEATETFKIQLSQPRNAIIGDGEAAVTITDNDGVKTAQSTLTINNVTKKEGRGAAKIIVTLKPPSNRQVKVNYATVNGSAKSPADYGSKKGVLTFNAGQTTKNIFITIKNDNQNEGNETLKVKLSNPVNAVLSPVAAGTIIIQNK
ncbi:MAG: Calx-beta domain-containing protein, partial [Gammaproteobacteria bacterium]